MIRFTTSFSHNSSLDRKIRDGIVQTILSYMDNMLEKTAARHGTETDDGKITKSYLMSAGERDFVQEYGYLFPAWYPVRRMFPTFVTLYDLLKDTSAEKTPGLECEYLLASIINDLTARPDAAGIRRTCLSDAEMTALQKELLDESREYMEGDIYYTEKDAEEEVKSYSAPCREWLDYLFDDADYELLDQMDMDTLRNSDLNARMGIIDQMNGNWWDADLNNKEHTSQ